MYHIVGLCPRSDRNLSGCGFNINLYPQWKAMVARSNLTQSMVANAIANLHRQWLDGCGFNAMFDPDEDPMARWESEKLGTPRKLSKNARPLYDKHSIQVAWGEWGVEHITVPGNACGLDIEADSLGAPLGGAALLPHNVDSRDQAMLLLVIFTWFADVIIAQGTRQ